MKFSIDFNWSSKEGDEILKTLGAELVQYEEWSQYEIEIVWLEELRDLQNKIRKIEGYELCTFIIDFEENNNIIYIDK